MQTSRDGLVARARKMSLPALLAARTLASNDPLRDDRRRYSAALTFYPSEFSKIRLQYDRDVAEHLLDDSESSLFLQYEFIFGAHGGHKF